MIVLKVFLLLSISGLIVAAVVDFAWNGTMPWRRRCSARRPRRRGMPSVIDYWEPSDNWKATHNTLGQAVGIVFVCLVMAVFSVLTVPYRLVRGRKA
jgi:hypothetical protein